MLKALLQAPGGTTCKQATILLGQHLHSFLAPAHLHAVGGAKNIHTLLAGSPSELNQQLCQQPARACICVAAARLAEAVDLILQGAQGNTVRHTA